MAEWVFPKATEEEINTIRIYRKPSKEHGIKYVFSSKIDGICEIHKRVLGVLALSFQARNSFKSLKILTMTKGAFGVDLTISITSMMGICFREWNGIETILIDECELRDEGSKARFRNCVPDSGKYKRIVDKNEVRHS